MTVTLEQMRSQLWTFDQAFSELEKTEPMSPVMIEPGTKVTFQLNPDWAETAKGVGMTDVVPAFVTINHKEYQFTKEGLFQAFSNIGIKPAYAVKTPSTLLVPQLEYWYGSGLGSNSHKLIAIQDRASAFIRPTITPFSNLELAHSVYDGIQQHYGKETEVLVDYKFHNSLGRTDVRLIIPTELTVMRDTNMLDVPPGSQDVWSTGISLRNSLTGKVQTQLDTYLFRWFCTNGAIQELDAVGTWSRKSNGQDEESVYEWAANAVDEVLGGMEYAFEGVQSLAYIKPAGNTGDVLNDIYKEHKIPVSQRADITDSVISANEVTMYTVASAISEQANNPTLSPERVDALMRTTGTLPTHYYDDKKAKIFRQGQAAGPEAPNPYEIQVR